MTAEIFKNQVTYNDKETNEVKTAWNFYIVFNGVRVHVRPVFKSDYRIMSMLADVEK